MQFSRNTTRLDGASVECAMDGNAFDQPTDGLMSRTCHGRHCCPRRERTILSYLPTFVYRYNSPLERGARRAGCVYSLKTKQCKIFARCFDLGIRDSLMDVLHLRSELSDSLQSDFALKLVFLGSLLIPRKEVIQPHLPIRLPCYDFTPIIGPTFDGYL